MAGAAVRLVHGSSSELGARGAVEALEVAAEPGVTESEAWAHFHFELMAKDGQHTVTRLFQSGPNTYPYFQEAGQRRLQAGELLALDTDANG